MIRTVKGSLLLLALLLLATPLMLRGQEEEDPAPPPAASSDELPDEPLRGRLPPYFADICTPEQRQEIYRIQARYEEPIAELRMRLDALIAERDAEVEGVLSDDQRDRLELARLQARFRRAQQARDRRDSPAEEATDAAAVRAELERLRRELEALEQDGR